jgi:Na+/melibiose symporter-like transporter
LEAKQDEWQQHDKTTDDRTKSSIGRRLPYIRYGSPIFALAFILLWIYFPGSDGNQTLLFIQLLTCLFIYDPDNNYICSSSLLN